MNKSTEFDPDDETIPIEKFVRFVGGVMPRYQSSKKVWAFKIVAIEAHKDGSATITPVEGEYAPISVDREYMLKHPPAVGGYYVVHVDGYKSWSPAEAFEAMYSRIPEYDPDDETISLYSTERDRLIAWKVVGVAVEELHPDWSSEDKGDAVVAILEMAGVDVSLPIEEDPDRPSQ